MRFEWDDHKARANIARHGVTFGEAVQVFDDPNLVESVDEEHSYNETRLVIIGHSALRTLFVVFAERHDDVIRIISARPPTPAERKLYEEGR